MKANEKYFLHYLEGHDKRFVIPVYQRNYDWKKEQCQQLFEDILGTKGRFQETYFIGSVVSISNDDASDREYVIIDGQQRITTISLLLLALRNLLQTGDITSQNAMLKDQINDNYLVNKYSDNEKRIRLKPVKEDNQAFLKLFEDDSAEYIQESNITKNYLYFVERIKGLEEDSISIDQLYDAIKKLVIVDIKLKRGEDNPQLIFESLNSTGKQLEEADLVRNFVLMDKHPRAQERFYESFWHSIEKNTNYRVGDFIRDYLTYVNGKTPRKDQVYVEFKRLVSEACGKDVEKLEKLLSELLKLSKFYNQFLFFDSENERINEALKRIDRLQVTVVYPFLLDVFITRGEGIISDDDVEGILQTIESFVFRRLICNVPNNALNKLFAGLGRNIRKYNSSNDDYVQAFNYLMASGVSSSRFPSDEEFFAELQKRDIYNLKQKNRIHLFERIENFNNREKVDVETLVETPKEGLTFEHIMPQTLSSKWKEDLGETHEQIHEKYLHLLGNVTLTAYNSELNNKPFIEKLNKSNGYKESRLWLNKSLSNLSSWGEKEIISRGELLASRAQEVWKIPHTTFVPERKIETQFNLYDEFSFTGTKPKSFTFMEEERQVKSWRELYQDATKLLYGLDSANFKILLKRKSTKRNISSNPNTLKTPWQLAEGIYLNVNLSADGIVAILKEIMDVYGLEENDLTVSLRENIDGMPEVVSDTEIELPSMDSAAE